MIVRELANYPPSRRSLRYCPDSYYPGDTRIILRSVTDMEKLEIEQLMDDIFVRNEMLDENLRLSHEPDSTVKHWIRQNIPFGDHFFSELGLKKVRRVIPTGGYTINYESGRSSNPYPAITFDSDYYRTGMYVGPQEEFRLPADGVNIFVCLHRVEYGDILINEVIKRFNPDFSEELRERKRVK